MTKIIMEQTPQSTQHIYGNRCMGKRVIRYLKKEGKDYKENLAKIAKEHFREPIVGNFVMRIDLLFPDKRRRDVDNYNKIILDALEGIAYIDDKQITTLIIRKWTDRKVGAIIIEVLPESLKNIIEVIL